MKRFNKKHLIVLFVFSLLITLISINAMAYSKNDIDPANVEFAKSEIFKFVGKDIEPNLIEVNNTEYFFMTDSGDYIVFDTKNGYVSKAYYNIDFNLFPKEDVIQINSIDAFNMAKDFAEEKYSSFKQRNLKLIKDELNDHGPFCKIYNYVWREQKDGIFTPNYVSISICPYTKKVMSYSARSIEVTAPTVPLVSKDEIVDKVKKMYSQSPSIEIELDITLNPITQEDYLRYSVFVYNKEGALGAFMFDAITGEEYRY